MDLPTTAVARAPPPRTGCLSLRARSRLPSSPCGWPSSTLCQPRRCVPSSTRGHPDPGPAGAVRRRAPVRPRPATGRHGQRVLLVLHLHAHRARRRPEARAEFVPFTAQTQVSGVDLAGPEGIRRIREGAAQTLLAASTAPTTEPGLDGCTRTGDVGRGGEGD